MKCNNGNNPQQDPGEKTLKVYVPTGAEKAQNREDRHFAFLKILLQFSDNCALLQFLVTGDWTLSLS